jgi:mannose-6-phosphate isomerase
MLYPLTFQPIFKERVWGGRKLQQLFNKSLQTEAPIGESWEVSDRPDEVSVIANGPLAGKDLHWLVENHRSELYGEISTSNPRFPLLIKILDAREKLSLQVHPPANVAGQLGGEPKTEMWYIVHAEPNSKLYLGLKPGVTKEDFERRLREGSVEEAVHTVPVKAGDAVFVPSGRIHAIDAGLVIFEIQQNSDTTYRVFDWNRVGLDGKPRELHVAESLASINFDDVEPRALHTKFSQNPVLKMRWLVHEEAFTVDAYKAKRPTRFHFNNPAPYIIGVVRGKLRATHGENELMLQGGQFGLFPACLGRTSFTAESNVEFLQAQLGA